MGHRISIFIAALAVALAIAAPAAAVVTATVNEGGSADVSLTVNSELEPTFSAEPTGGLIITFSEVIPVAGTEDFWASIMTVNAAAAGPGEYEVPLEVRNSGGTVVTETVVVTVEAAGAPPTTSAPTPPPATTATTSAAATTTAPTTPATTTTTITSTTTSTTTIPETTLPPTAATSTTSPSTKTVPATESAPETTVIAIGTPLEPDDGFPTGPAMVFGAAALVVVGAGLAFYAYSQRPRHRGLRLPSYSVLEEEDGSAE